MWLCTSLHSHSILWLCLGGLAIKVPLQSPVTLTMASQTNIFSTPLSMWTHGGRKPPYFSIASSNNCNTVSARLLGLHLRNITLLENALMPNQLPSYQWMVAIQVPEEVWPRDTIDSAGYFSFPPLKQSFEDPALPSILWFYFAEYNIPEILCSQ